VAKPLDESRLEIARQVRALRQQRHWTQAELARRLGLSQARFSEIERGGGSFTAEQFLAILKLFNVGASHFATSQPDPESELQKALARLGAEHLQEDPDVLPSEKLEAVNTVIREALVTGSPRLVTAIAPVLVCNIERVNLTRLRSELVRVGLERRFGWLLGNIAEAIRHELAEPLPRNSVQRYRQALVVIDAALALDAHDDVPSAVPVDILEPGVRSNQTLKETWSEASDISRRWSIASALRPEDFAHALRSARAG